MVGKSPKHSPTIIFPDEGFSEKKKKKMSTHITPSGLVPSDVGVVQPPGAATPSSLPVRLTPS